MFLEWNSCAFFFLPLLPLAAIFVWRSFFMFYPASSRAEFWYSFPIQDVHFRLFYFSTINILLFMFGWKCLSLGAIIFCTLSRIPLCNTLLTSLPILSLRRVLPDTILYLGILNVLYRRIRTFNPCPFKTWLSEFISFYFGFHTLTMAWLLIFSDNDSFSYPSSSRSTFPLLSYKNIPSFIKDYRGRSFISLLWEYHLMTPNSSAIL